MPESIVFTLDENVQSPDIEDPQLAFENALLSFCLAARMVQGRPAEHYCLEDDGVFDGDVYVKLDEVLFKSEETWNAATFPDWKMTDSSSIELVRLYSNTYMAAAAFTYQLYAEWRSHPWSHERHMHALSAIPFTTFIHPPDPFAPAIEWLDPDLMLLSHVSGMTEPAFLNDGEWVGFRVDTQQDEDDVGPRLQNVHFQATATIWTVHLAAQDGREGDEPFTLQGDIDRSSGRVRMQQQFTTGDTDLWLWAGFITPFGMLGTWGTQYWGLPHFMGWFWLWKKAWESGAEEASSGSSSSASDISSSSPGPS